MQAWLKLPHVKGHIKRNEAGLILYRKKIWVPHDQEELLHRLCIGAHCGLNPTASEPGHRGVNTTVTYLREYVNWEGLSTFVKRWIKNCTSCIKDKETGEFVPRPMGHQKLASKRGQVISMDYMYIGKYDEEPYHEPDKPPPITEYYQYILVIKDHYSGYVELIPCRTCDSETAAQALQWWIARFTTPDIIISDNGTHFTAKIIERLTAICGISHELCVAYSPWSNGSVERVNRDIKALLKILMRVSDDPWENWHYFLPAVMKILNEAPTTALGAHAPKEVFMGFEAFNPLNTVFHPQSMKFTAVNITAADVASAVTNLKQRIAELGVITQEKMQEQMEKSGAEKLAWRKYRASELDIPVTKLKARDLLPNFAIGDFVMVALPARTSDHKLMARWRGPYRIHKAITRYEYEVQHLVTREVTNAHIRRIKFYADKELDYPVPLAKEVTAEDVFSKIYEVEEVCDIKFNKETKQFEALIKWSGFDIDEGTWQALKIACADVPNLVNEYVDSLEESLQKGQIVKTIERIYKDIEAGRVPKKKKATQRKKRKA